MLRGRFNKRSIKHSIQSSDVHAEDKQRQSDFKQRKKKVKFIAVEVDEPRPDPFESNVSGIGGGRNYTRDADGVLREQKPEEWEAKALELGRVADIYHRPMTRPNGETYWRKEKIEGGDLERWTTELRPDHSRALELICGDKFIARGKIDEALAKIHAEQVRLFESIYGRKVMMVSEHTDSGHYHTDLWNLGLEPQEVEENGKKKAVVLRTPMREKGVGPGTARYFRHGQALTESGKDAGKVLGVTSDVIRQNIAVAKEQNGEDPRDIRYVSALDSVVGKVLNHLSPKACEKALEDYSGFLVSSYKSGDLGARRLQHREARKLEELQGEVGKLKKLLELAVSLFNAVLKFPSFMEAVKKLNLYEKLAEFGKAVGIQLAPKEPVKGRSRTRTRERRKTKEKAKEPEMEKPKRSRRIKPPEEPSSPGIA